MRIYNTGNYSGKASQGIDFNDLFVAKIAYTLDAFADWHYHENPVFILVIKGGSLEQRKKYSIECIPGTALYYHSHEPHCNKLYKPGSQSLGVEFKNNWLKKYDVDFSLMEKIIVIHDTHIKTLFRNIYREISLHDAVSYLSIEGMLLQAVGELVNIEKREKKIPLWMKKVVEILNDSPGDDISLADIGKAANVHPVTVSKEFPRYFHCNFGDYKRKKKLEIATAMLAKRSIPLSQIAIESGFTDASHFVKVFKSFNHITPSEFRNMI